jgi:hypothetical protein
MVEPGLIVARHSAPTDLRYLSHLEPSTMRSLTLTCAAMVAATLLTGCGTESGPTAENDNAVPAYAIDHNAVDHTTYTLAISETNINPCNGEEVELAGTLVGHWYLVGPGDVLDPDHKLHEQIHEVVSEMGTGLTTGASYALHATFTLGFNTPNFSAPNATFRERQKIRIRSTTPGLTYSALATFYLVTLPNGEQKLTRVDEDHFVCEG